MKITTEIGTTKIVQDEKGIHITAANITFNEK